MTENRFYVIYAQELFDFSADHLYYELWMLYETGARLVHDPAVPGDFVLRNSLIESFTVHARTLAAFLYPDEVRPRDDDVISDHYVKDIEEWRTARGPMPPELKEIMRRTGKEIAHLTTKRLPPGDPKKAWAPGAIVQALTAPLKLFRAHVPPGRLDLSVTHFIAELPAPATAEASTASGPFGSTSVPTGQITHRTDVSTP
jgi:hypothetical protein